MKMNDPQGWFASVHTPEAFADMVHAAQAVEVTARAGARLPDRSRLVVVNEVFDRYVTWDSRATRDHGISLDEADRLEALVDAGSKAACGGASCFVLKCADCRGPNNKPMRVVLTVTSYGGDAGPRWLVHH